jgi:hypothetical protein
MQNSLVIVKSFIVNYGFHALLHLNNYLFSSINSDSNIIMPQNCILKFVDASIEVELRAYDSYNLN